MAKGDDIQERMFVFLKRKLVWLEALIIAILMPTIIFALTYVGRNQSLPINLLIIFWILALPLLVRFRAYFYKRCRYFLYPLNAVDKSMIKEFG